MEFTAFKTQSCFCQNKKSEDAHRMAMNNLILAKKESFNLVEITFERNLNCYKHVADLATSSAKKLGFLFLPPICKQHISLR